MGDDLLIVQRGNGLWGIAPTAVRSFQQAGSTVRLELVAGALSVDSVIGVTSLGPARPPGPVFRRYWPEACLGLTTFAERPVVIVDPDLPPTALSASKGEINHD